MSNILFTNTQVCILLLLFSFSCTDSSFLTKISKTINRSFRKIGQFIGIKESCTEAWINTNTRGLEWYLSQKLLGQPIAQKYIPLIFDQHWKDELLYKHLLLCFYGTPGTGKTFTTKLLNNFIFSQGDKSYFYLFFTGSQSHLPQNSLKRLKDEMTESIEDALTECPFTIVVFDEADNYPHGFLDTVILPFLNRRSSNEKATFIFLTNIGSNKVLDKALEIHNSYDKNFGLNEFNTISSVLKKESQDSFFTSRLVQLGYVKSFIPFLPHKIDSFTGCLQSVLSNQLIYKLSDEAVKSEIISDMIKELSLVPKHDPVFVSHGCKHIESLVARKLASLKPRRNKNTEF